MNEHAMLCLFITTLILLRLENRGETMEERLQNMKKRSHPIWSWFENGGQPSPMWLIYLVGIYGIGKQHCSYCFIYVFFFFFRFLISCFLISVFSDLDSKDVRFVGICGMPGIGKTTLVEVLFDRISDLFDAFCFLRNVSEVCKRSSGGLVQLQKLLLSKALPEEIEIRDERQGTSLISTKLGHLKILIVVDEVDNLEQLEKLAGKFEWFGKGSRIIVTTRDRSILRAHGVNRVHEVEPLNHDEALQLFCRYAFRDESDNRLNEFKEVINWVIEYASGLPITIIELALVMFDTDESKWRNIMADFEQSYLPFMSMELLQSSFDSLENEEKEIFLDIACFFEGSQENYVMEILDLCGYNPAAGIQVLLGKSLITIVNRTFKMHKLLQRLGWIIAQGNLPSDPTKWSRLWLYDDFQHILQTNTVSSDILNILLSDSRKLKAIQNKQTKLQLSFMNILCLLSELLMWTDIISPEFISIFNVSN